MTGFFLSKAYKVQPSNIVFQIKKFNFFIVALHLYCYVYQNQICLIFFWNDKLTTVILTYKIYHQIRFMTIIIISTIKVKKTNCMDFTWRAYKVVYRELHFVTKITIVCPSGCPTSRLGLTLNLSPNRSHHHHLLPLTTVFYLCPSSVCSFTKEYSFKIIVNHFDYFLKERYLVSRPR